MGGSKTDVVAPDGYVEPLQCYQQKCIDREGMGPDEIESSDSDWVSLGDHSQCDESNSSAYYDVEDESDCATKCAGEATRRQLCSFEGSITNVSSGSARASTVPRGQTSRA